jgi:Holliday junction resolvase RusA-like endonuclease
MTYTIRTVPRTKKTSNQAAVINGRARVFPSAKYRAFARAAIPQLRSQHMIGPLTEPVHVKATFYREANRGDLIGYMQALADVLEEAGVLANDRQIVCWDGTTMTKDAESPRVEFEVLSLSSSAR